MSYLLTKSTCKNPSIACDFKHTCWCFKLISHDDKLLLLPPSEVIEECPPIQNRMTRNYLLSHGESSDGINLS